MRLILLGVGRLRPALREVCDDYLRRLGRTAQVEEKEVREAGRAESAQARREEEDRRLLKLIPNGAGLTLLDPNGARWSSEEIATRLDRWRLAARDRAIVIGGAEGVGQAVQDRADERWSLGPMILPHELARIVVVEQLYRAGTILRGEPYHRGSR